MDKGHLRPLRLLNFAAVLAIITFLASRFRNWFQYQPVCYLGRHSLEVFSFHVVLLLLFNPLGAYLNSLYAIQLSATVYAYPLGTLLLLVLVPALYLAPALKGGKGAGFLKFRRGA